MKNPFLKLFSIAGYALVIAMFLSAISFTSCKKSEEGGGSGSSIAVTSVSLNKTTLSLAVGGTETLTATVLPENATNKELIWESDKEAVATVYNGTVSAISEGSATITVKSADGKKSAKCEVTVNSSSSVTEIKLNKTTLSLEIGAKETLTANTKVKWSSSAPLIASVTAEGVVTGIAVGKATITATSEDGKLTAKCEVEVKAVAVTGIKLNTSETITMAVGGTQTISCTVSPDNAGNKNVKWTTSDNSKVEISSQNNTSITIKATAVGNSTITATTEDGNHTAKCIVTVEAPAGFEGAGTEADPYRISTLEDLKTLATMVNSGTGYSGEYFKLMNNINLGGSSSPWTPIGSDDVKFMGNFDGNSKTVSGLYINQPTLDNQALFGFILRAEIKNLTVNGSVIGKNECGGIVAIAWNSTITSCTSDVTIIGESNYVGGIVGRGKDSKITNCTNRGTIIGKSDQVGGIVGLDDGSTITNCTNRGTIIGEKESCSVGGIMGSSIGYSLISDCSNSGNVSGYSTIGGIAGVAYYLLGCSNSGTISSEFEGGIYFGGIVGQVCDNGGIVSCYNTGAVTAPKCSSIGGVVGWNEEGVVSSCYNIGAVSGDYYVGGVVGQNARQVIASYNRGAVSGGREVGGVIGRFVSKKATATMSYCLNAADGGIDAAVGFCGEEAIVGTDVAALSKRNMTNGTMLNDLNTAVDSYNSTKPEEAPIAKKFKAGTGGWPEF